MANLTYGLHFLHILRDVLDLLVEVLFGSSDIFLDVITRSYIHQHCFGVIQHAWDIHGACQRNENLFVLVGWSQFIQGISGILEPLSEEFTFIIML